MKTMRKEQRSPVQKLYPASHVLRNEPQTTTSQIKQLIKHILTHFGLCCGPNPAVSHVDYSFALHGYRFKCSDMTVRITSDNVLLELQLPFSSHSRRFLDETCKACHGVDKQHMSVDPCPRFLWLSKYLPKSALASVSEKKGAFIPAAEFKGIETEASDNMRKTGTATVNGKSQVSEETKQNIQNISDNNAVRDGKVKPEVSNDMVRSSSYTVANKAQMLAMPQFELRDNLIKCELLKREESYTFTKDYRFFVGTYNVNGQSPKESLLPWLKGGTEPPDIYLVGFQELDLSKEAFIFSDTPKEQEWSKAVHEGLHPESKYAMIKVIRLVGIMLLFYVKKELAEYISAIEAEYVGTGIMGRMGNKGAVGIRFNFHNSSLCIVNCHLAAHTEEYERRNQDFRDICSRLTFRSFDPVLPNLPIMKHDTVLWFGDLNYRISDVDVEQVKKLIDERDFKTLYKYDQLKKQMEEKAVFDGFTEGELKFQPTYKYDTGSDQWDTSNHSVAEALLLFLDALPEPVICYSHYHQSLDSSGSHTQCKQADLLVSTFTLLNEVTVHVARRGLEYADSFTGHAVAVNMD
ncbi:I5P2 phosphatase, partial [Polypterus senegalus]